MTDMSGFMLLLVAMSWLQQQQQRTLQGMR
jgi:hypothetical protein